MFEIDGEQIYLVCKLCMSWQIVAKEIQIVYLVPPQLTVMECKRKKNWIQNWIFSYSYFFMQSILIVLLLSRLYSVRLPLLGFAFVERLTTFWHIFFWTSFRHWAKRRQSALGTRHSINNDICNTKLFYNNFPLRFFCSAINIVCGLKAVIKWIYVSCEMADLTPSRCFPSIDLMHGVNMKVIKRQQNQFSCINNGTQSMCADQVVRKM